MERYIILPSPTCLEHLVYFPLRASALTRPTQLCTGFSMENKRLWFEILLSVLVNVIPRLEDSCPLLSPGSSEEMVQVIVDGMIVLVTVVVLCHYVSCPCEVKRRTWDLDTFRQEHESHTKQGLWILPKITRNTFRTCIHHWPDQHKKIVYRPI